MNERTHFFIKIYLSHFIRKGWCWLCVRGELETGTDCYIWAQISPDHSSTSFAFWLGCSTVGHFGPKALRLPLTLNSTSCPQLTPTAAGIAARTRTDPSRLWHLVIFLFDVHMLSVGVRICTKFNHVHRSRWYSDIFDRMHMSRFSFDYLHRCISWLTARSRVSMLNFEQR